MTKRISDLLRIGLFFMMGLTVVLMVIAIADHGSAGEAPIGTFSADSFDEGWMIEHDGVTEEVTLPVSVDVPRGTMITMTNRLPEDLGDGMSLMVRAAMEDVHIFVDGDPRAVYASECIEGMSYNIPSAYVVADLNRNDSGREIRILVRVKSKGTLNGIRISHGNNVWFDVIRRALPVNIVGLVVLIMGTMLHIAAAILNRKYNVRATGYLGFLMIDVGMWVLSESLLRQLIFARPSMSQYFSFFTMELIGAITCMYFDEVQHHTYRKRYLAAEGLVFLQLIINIILHLTGTVTLYRSLAISHVWTGVCAVLALSAIIEDFVRGRWKSYAITLIGMISFMVMALAEMVEFYSDRFHIFGTWVCIALLLLMIATVMQTIYDEVHATKMREEERNALTISTIETIAGAIDARDEYTGGHSGRVGLYAETLAREIAAERGLTEEDIRHIHYTGLVHDIGKIGVADNVLNKSGRLTDDEFCVMRKHPETGYEIMKAVGENIGVLLDGIRYHHERFDGKGYPEGISGTDIPLIARILALADSYDAMTSDRVYRKRLTDAQVRSELVRCSGTQFDPALTEVFIRLLDEGKLHPAAANDKA